MRNKIQLILALTSFIFIHEITAQITFEKTYGSTFYDEAKSIRQTPDGGYIIGGTDLVKIDENGNEEWTKPYPSTFVNTTFDGGYILVYSNSPDIIFTKVNVSGDTIWQTKNRDGLWANEGYYIEQTSDSGFIVSGRFQSVTGSGMLLLKLNSTGNKVWRRTFSESTSAGFNTGYSFQQTADNGYIIAGNSKINYYDSTRHEDVFIVKTDSNGNEQWRRFFGGSKDDVGYSVQQDADQNYLIAGRTNSYNTSFGSNMYLIKLDTNGDSLWTKTYGGMYMEAATEVWTTTDGGYILTGSSNTFSNGDFDGYVVKTDNNGDTLWTNHYGGQGVDALSSIQQTTDSGFIMAGITNSSGAGDVDMYVLKTNALGEIQAPSGVDTQTISKVNMVVYPNPGSGFFHLNSTHIITSVTVFNLLGQIIYVEPFLSQDVQIDLSGFPNGTYFYQATSIESGVINTGKMVIQ